MLKNSTFEDFDTKLINKLYESCKTCFKSRNFKPKSKVGPPMAQDLNHTVCMDLNIWHGTGTIILYIIDIFTRFTIAKIIPDKTPDSILKVLVNDWIKFWGSPSLWGTLLSKGCIRGKYMKNEKGAISRLLGHK